MEWWNRLESPDMNPHRYHPLTCISIIRPFSLERMVFSTVVVEKVESHWLKKKERKN